MAAEPPSGYKALSLLPYKKAVQCYYKNYMFIWTWSFFSKVHIMPMAMILPDFVILVYFVVTFVRIRPDFLILFFWMFFFLTFSAGLVKFSAPQCYSEFVSNLYSSLIKSVHTLKSLYLS